MADIVYTRQFVNAAQINGKTLIFNTNGAMNRLLYGSYFANADITMNMDKSYTIFESNAFREWFIGCFVPILVFLFVGAFLCYFTARSIIKRDQDEWNFNAEMNQRFENEQNSPPRRQSTRRTRKKKARRSKRKRKSKKYTPRSSQRYK